MAIEYMGDTFIPLPAQDNALALLDTINGLLVTNNVKDSDGNQAVIYVNVASPIWLILLAVGTAITVFQYLVQAAGDSLNIESCSNQQVLNLATVAGVDRTPGTRTNLAVTVTATAAGCTITPADLLFYSDSISFAPLTTTVIGSNASVVIQTQATEDGALIILPGEINHFISTPVGVASVSNALASIPGTEQESVTSLRRRIQQGSGLVSSLDAAIGAIRGLPGINQCNIFFNPSLVSNLVLEGGTVLGPRQAAIFVYGSSSLLAETYLEHMLSETVGALTQVYTTLGGQSFTVRYENATLKYYYVRVYVATGSGQEGYLTEIQRLLIGSSATLDIGQDYSQQYLLNYLDDFPYATIIGLQVSMDNVSWSDITAMEAVDLGVLSSSYITAVEK